MQLVALFQERAPLSLVTDIFHRTNPVTLTILRASEWDKFQASIGGYERTKIRSFSFHSDDEEKEEESSFVLLRIRSVRNSEQ